MSSRSSFVTVPSLAAQSSLTDNHLMTAVGARYESSLIQVLDGQAKGFAIDSYGRQIIIGPATEAATLVASPIYIGGAYRATLPTYADGQQAAVHHDSRGRVIVTDDQALTELQSLNTAFGSEDFASEATLDALLTAFNAEDFASEVTLDALLTAFNAEDFASEVTLSAMSAKLPASLGAQNIANSVAVNIASDQTVPISAAALPLPAGAATQATLDAVRVAVESMDNGHTIEGSYYINYASSNLPGNASLPLEIVASLPLVVKKISVWDTAGVPCELMVGPSSSEVRRIVLGPGVGGEFSIPLSPADRVSIRRLDGAAAVTGGDLSINFIG